MEKRSRARRESHALLSCGAWVAQVLAWDPQALNSADPERELLPDTPPKLPDDYVDPKAYLELLSRYRLLETAASLASDAREASAARCWHGVVVTRERSPSGDDAPAIPATADLLVRLDPPPPAGTIGAEDALLVRCASEAWDSSAGGGGGGWLALALVDANSEVWLRVSVPRSSGGGVGSRLVLRRLGTLLPALRMQAALRAHAAAPRWMLGCRVRRAAAEGSQPELTPFERAMAQSKARALGHPSPNKRSPGRPERANGESTTVVVSGAAGVAGGIQIYRSISISIYLFYLSVSVSLSFCLSIYVSRQPRRHHSRRLGRGGCRGRYIDLYIYTSIPISIYL